MTMRPSHLSSIQGERVGIAGRDVPKTYVSETAICNMHGPGSPIQAPRFAISSAQCLGKGETKHV